MSLLPRFCLSPVSREPVVVAGPTAPPLMVCLNFSASSRGNIPRGNIPCGNISDNAESPATSRRVGSFNWDWEQGRFTRKWANLAEFETWHRVEEHASSIELVASTTRADGKLWSRWQLFVCRRQDSGGGRTYQKKNPNRECTIPHKKTGCRCEVLIKQYPHTSTILGCYVADHDHEIGAANIAHTCLSGTTWEQIKMMLIQTIDRREIMSCRNQNSLAADLIHLKVRMIWDLAPHGSCDYLIALKEVNQIAHALDNDKIRLHPDDAISTRLLIGQLAAQDTRTFYKDRQDRTPIDSRLPGDPFVLCIQTSFQLDTFWRLRKNFIGIDATHNITQYQNILLFTIVARDDWGHGE